MNWNNPGFWLLLNNHSTEFEVGNAGYEVSSENCIRSEPTVAREYADYSYYWMSAQYCEEGSTNPSVSYLLITDDADATLRTCDGNFDDIILDMSEEGGRVIMVMFTGYDAEAGEQVCHDASVFQSLAESLVDALGDRATSDCRNHCDYDPCVNGGECFNDHYGVHCECPNDQEPDFLFGGDYCEECAEGY
eukprot:UN29570